MRDWRLFFAAVKGHTVEMVGGSLFGVAAVLWGTAQWIWPTLVWPAFKPWMLFAIGTAIYGRGAFCAWRDEYRRTTESGGKVSALEQQRTAFDLRVMCGNPQVLRNKDKYQNGFYVVVAEASITNAAESQVPIKVSLRIDLSDTSAISEVAKSLPLPEWALIGTPYSDKQQSPRFINIPGRTASPIGYWAFAFRTNGFVDIDADMVLEQPLWLELQNTITEEVRLFAVNNAASIARIRRKGLHVLPTE